MNPLNTSNSLATNFNQVNRLMNDFQNDKTVRIFKDDQGTPVVILNKDGLKTTSPGSGIDVTQATDDQYTFNSNQNVFKIVKSASDSIKITASTGTTTKTIPHGLGYVPALLVYMTDSTGSSYQALPTFLSYSIGATAITIATIGFCSIDSTNIYIQVSTAGSVLVGTTLLFKYYLLQEKAN